MKEQRKDRLFAEFQKSSYADWRKEAELQLDGAPFEKKLVTETAEGIALQPIYTADQGAGAAAIGALPGEANYVRGASHSGYLIEPWRIEQGLELAGAADFNAALKDDLSRGQNAVMLSFDAASRRGLDADEAPLSTVGECGVSIATADELERALRGIDLSRFPIFIRCGASGVPAAVMFEALVEKNGVEKKQISGGVLFDPLGELAESGELAGALGDYYRAMAALAVWGGSFRPDFSVIAIDVGCYLNAGASAVQEIGVALATGAEYLRELMKLGVEPAAALSRIRVFVAVGPQFFMEIAKCRALRAAWCSLAEGLGVRGDGASLRLHARTGLYDKTLFDPYVNMLRNTTEAFSAVLGGVEGLSVGRVDELSAPPSEFSRRIARNTQIILQEECSVTGVIDPAGGSYLVEELTEELARKGWALFQEIERTGGMSRALESGLIQKMVKETAAARAKRFSQRRDVLVGTNMYANTGERAPNIPEAERGKAARKRAQEAAGIRSAKDNAADRAILARLNEIVNGDLLEAMPAALAAAKEGATLGELSRALYRGKTESIGVKVERLSAVRLAASYEMLRLACEEALKKTGAKPKLFLLNMGPLRQHKARADFSAGFFEVGGFEVVYPNGFETPDAASDALLKSGAKIAVICSTDETYPELVPALCRTIKAKDSAVKLILAGFPGENEASYRSAGLDDYIFVKSNNYEVLERYLRALEVLQ